MPATIEIDVQERWDAVALMRRLNRYHSYLVQFAPERWLVHAECPGGHGEQLPNALAVIEESLAARQVEDAAVRVDGRAYRPATGAKTPRAPSTPKMKRRPHGTQRRGARRWRRGL